MSTERADGAYYCPGCDSVIGALPRPGDRFPIRLCSTCKAKVEREHLCPDCMGKRFVATFDDFVPCHCVTDNRPATPENEGEHHG